MLIPAPSGSLPILVDGKSPPRDSHDNTFIGKEIEVRGLGFGATFCIWSYILLTLKCLICPDAPFPESNPCLLPSLPALRVTMLA